MQRLAKTRKFPFVPIAGLMVLIVAGLAAMWLARAQANASERVVHTLHVELGISHVLERARAIESNHRAFLIAGDPAFLADMHEAIDDLWSDFDQLREQTADNPAQQANIAALTPILRAKVAFAEQSTGLLRQNRGTEARALVESGRGKALMEQIRVHTDRMTEEEQRLLVKRWGETRDLITALGFGLAGGLLLVILVATIVVIDARRRSLETEAARDDARASAAALRLEMSAREEIESAIRQMQKMESIGQLTGGIAHDFNNMLAIIIGSLDLAERHLDKKDDESKLRKSISNAREGAERAATLTARLLAFGRLQPLAPVALDANKLVSGMSELLRRTIGEQVGVETVLAGGLWKSYVDPGQLENAILNLAVNARDAMPEGGRLTIETANAHLDDDYARSRADVAPGQYVLICISDTGSGMPPEVMSRAFDPFFTTKEVGKGTGLGLSQVFGFVKQSGGHVAIYSEPGAGTTIKLYLPRHHGGAIASDSPVKEEALPEGRADEIILVVEDEQRVRHFSVDALRELGYTAISASSGRDALELLREQPSISMLFTDIVMPEMDGRRLAEQAVALQPGLRILYTTGYTRNAVVHNGMLDAGVAFLAKPFTIAQLARKVREVLDGAGVNRPV
jgi:signal transduction histidine kinase/ActR/RegA family two-component response regulator